MSATKVESGKVSLFKGLDLIADITESEGLKKNLKVYLEENISTLNKIVSGNGGMRPNQIISNRGLSHIYDMPPLNSNTESYANIEENGFKSVTLNPLSTFSVDVDGASYSNIRRYINGGALPPIDAVRVEEMINYFNCNYIHH